MFKTGALRRHTILGLTSSPLDSVAFPSLFLGGNNSHSRRVSMDKAAAVRDKKEQAKQVFQMSTVNGQGMFLPPEEPQLEKGFFKEHCALDCGDEEHDHFSSIIINTPPERIRTFLSTESKISPGLFSSRQSSRIKRNTIPSFNKILSSSEPSSPVSSQQPRRRVVSSSKLDPNVSNSKTNSIITTIVDPAVTASVSSPYLSSPFSPSSSATSPRPLSVTPVAFVKTRQALTPADTLSTPPSSPADAPLKDAYFTSKHSAPRSYQSRYIQQHRQWEGQEQQLPPSHRNNKIIDVNPIRSKNKAQISFLTGETEKEDNLLSSDAISEWFQYRSILSSSTLPAPPPPAAPELITDDEEEGRFSTSGSGSGSDISTPDASPRQHSALMAFQKKQTKLIHARTLRAQNDFGGALPISH
ncbi:hypothetical protein BGX28_005636 [Mortierella sp. GBA30]|nr:hypothetical protein BGX28_005636 [Mortierella sp. GBA30]